MKDKEFVTLCRALDLKENDSVVIRKFDAPEKEIIYVVGKVAYDSDTGVAFLQTLKGNVILASSIASLERNRMLKGKVQKSPLSENDIGILSDSDIEPKS